jgi:hypothetical protein
VAICDSRRPPTPKKERAPKPLIVKPAVVKPVGPAALVERKGKPLAALRPGQCHYPINDPERGGEFLFCAEPIAKSGANYCSRHAEIAVRVSSSPSRESCGWRALLSPLARDLRPRGETTLARCPAPPPGRGASFVDRSRSSGPLTGF